MKFSRISIIAMACVHAAACNSSEDIIEPPAPPAEDSKLIEVEVIDYSPAPGQFINELPKASSADTETSIKEKVRAALCTGKAVSLGAWGGSVTLRLSSPIENYAGPDFRILGNAFITGKNGSGAPYGSAEPGIVEVMCDDNANGLPDDTWYELKGAGYDISEADVTVTYYAPQPNASNEKYIRWECSDGSSGWINRMVSQHPQPFFPLWQSNTTITKTGRRLPDNGEYNQTTKQYDLYNIEGYADSFPDSDIRSALDISDAVDKEGRFVDIRNIHFIRVTTGVLQTNGPLGECSTEIFGVEAIQNN